MAGFPSFEPVLTAEVDIICWRLSRGYVISGWQTTYYYSHSSTWECPIELAGQVGGGEFMTVLSLTGGRIRGVEGGILSGLIDAECINGIDVSRADAAQSFTRLKVESIWKNKDDSEFHLTYDAIVRMTEGTKHIFFGHPDAKTTPFGDISACMKFYAGNTKLKALEESIFVGSGRFIVETGESLKVEYKIGRMVG